MPVSPQTLNADVIACRVRLAGVPLADTAAILEIEVQREVGRLPSARVVLADGDMVDGDWTLADSDACLPGTEIEIQAGCGSALATIFKGLIVRTGVSIGVDNTSRLTLDCSDKAVAMTLARRREVYAGQTDSAVMRTLIARAGLDAAVDRTAFAHEALVQLDCSDWDYVCTLAEANGLLVIADDGTLRVQAPALDGQPALQLTWGQDLLGFEAVLDARLQPARVEAVAWDAVTQTLLAGAEALPAATPGLGDLGPGTIAALLGADVTRRLQLGSAADPAWLAARARADQVWAALSRVRATARFQGSALAKVGGLLLLSGVGRRFAGALLIGRLVHRIAEGQWTTEVGLGVDPSWHRTGADRAAVPQSARVSGVAGLQVGIVRRLDGDPAGGQRIQIALPAIAGTHDTLWARLLQPHASRGSGLFVLPEVGDEVLVGFFDQNPGEPIVLGSVHSRRREPPFPFTASNDTKALVTRAGHQLVLDEHTRAITLTTPGANKVVLDDEAGAIQLSDQHGNQVRLDVRGILLEAVGDVVLQAGGRVAIGAGGDLNLSSSGGDLHASAGDITCQARSGFVAHGVATAELSASGQTTVKGPIVMIN